LTLSKHHVSYIHDVNRPANNTVCRQYDRSGVGLLGRHWDYHRKKKDI